MSKPFVLPRRVQVGPFPYELRRDEGLVADESWATHDAILRRISFRPAAGPSELLPHFVHELIHAIEDVWGMDLTHDDVKRIANSLVQVLQSVGLLPEGAVLEGEDA